MRSTAPEKLLRLIDEIDDHGHTSLHRLAVLAAWFKPVERPSSFGLWVAKRSAGRKGKTTGEAGALLDEARKLLGITSTRESFLHRPSPQAAALLHEQAAALLSAMTPHACRPLLLVRQGLALYLGLDQGPEAAYALAAAFCQHHDPRLGETLCGPSRTKLFDLIDYMHRIEAIEEDEGR
ncbi:MAG: hypothetical protein JNG86_08840 [Verrucomicrobiaceae bacterium]|nr:hypothetical protein [Verrucomicrobiaceae bacterium]